MRKKICLLAALMVLPTLAAAENSAALNPGSAQPPSETVTMVPVQSKFNLTIGGFVRLDYAYNSENFGPAGWWSPSSGAPPSSNALSHQEQSIFSPKATRLLLKSTGPDYFGAKTSAMIEGDFNGDNSSGSESPMFRLRIAKAEMKWNNFEVLFGEDWDIFGPMVAASLDFRNGTVYGTPNSQRVPQIRVTKTFAVDDNNAIKLVLGVQDPSQQGNNLPASTGGFGPCVNGAGQLSFVSKSLGTAPGFYGLSMRPLTATFFALGGTENAPSDGNHGLPSYGYGFYTFVPIISSKDNKSRSGSVSFEGQVYEAANMAFNYATAAAVTGTPTTVSATYSNSWGQSPAQGYGYAAQIIAYPTQELGVTVGYGSRNARDFSSYSKNANFQESNASFYANLAYDFNAAVRVATEYQNLRTKYGNPDAVGTDNTLRLVATYFF